jgi:DNA-binding LacI/PurR family transcriptional regulator
MSRSGAPKSGATTLEDIAQAAGVSKATVHRVVTGSGPASTATRKEITRVAKEMGYKPVRRSGSTGRQRQPVLGVIIRDVADPFYSYLVKAVIKAAHPWEVLLGYSESNTSHVRRLEQILGARRIEGILLVGDILDIELCRQLARLEDPVVAVCSHMGPWSANEAPSADAGATPKPEREQFESIRVVKSDSEAGIKDLYNLLRIKGHRRIAFVGAPDNKDIDERLQVYRTLTEQENLPPGYVQKVAPSPDGGRVAIRSLFALDEPPTAVMAAVDNIAIGAIQQVWQLGKKVGEDISITGFDDIPAAEYTWPRLTTVAQDVDRIAVEAVKVVRARLNGQAYEPPLLPTRLIEGSSVGSPPAPQAPPEPAD